MPTEQSPLLAQDQRNSPDADTSQTIALPSEDIYCRFSRKRKRLILAIVSLTGLVPMLVGGCFIPSISQISKDLHSTPAVVSLSLSLAVLSSSIGVMFWSAYSSFYGRRVTYICGMPLTILGSFATAASTDISGLLLWRFVQMFGCCGGYALGAATIGDIYRVEERGTAMGTFLGATIFGLAVSPTLGGVWAQYWSWRAFQVALGVWSVIQFLLLIVLFPETAHPGTRGIDKLQGPEKWFVWVNPFRCLTFLRSPNILAVTLANTLALLTDYTLVIPIAYTVGAKYGITSEGLIGVFFLPSGIGNCLGALVAGRMSDRIVRRAKERKGGWIPEDRLRATWIGGLVLTPVSVTLAGLSTTYIEGTVGLVISLFCLFCNGLGVNMVLTPIGAYMVDIVPSRSAEVMAALAAFRSLLLSPACALLIPSVETIGAFATDGISAIFALFGYLLVWLTIRYGKQMRAYVDVGYPDFDAQASSRDMRN